MTFFRRLPPILLLFWSLWFSLVFASNLTNGLQQLGWASSDWPFSSGNFELVKETVSIYGLPATVAAILFAGVLAVQFFASILFWRSLLGGNAPDEPGEDLAFGVAVALFAAFIVADELFIVYDRIGDLESSHFIVLCGLLLSVLVIRIAGRDEKSERSWPR